eukprot:TRINITY_DN1032_c0_g1_i1.p1 TRINITY_DN1032_c0_g1~~TRINITY_DN1032_c0_g1_i1.p1  ORF type:complete len:776 (-),score=126.55 TRINITY_DN1032_c0_g1_i1:171-2498(-)
MEASLGTTKVDSSSPAEVFHGQQEDEDDRDEKTSSVSSSDNEDGQAGEDEKPPVMMAEESDHMKIRDEDDDDDDDENYNDGQAGPRLVRGGSIFGDGGELKPRKHPMVPITIEFEHLRYSVRVRKGGLISQLKKRQNPFAKEDKFLLKDLSATLYPNEVTAIMGPSGAGKTTLLNLLAGRLGGGKQEGSVTVNGVKRSHISNAKWQRLCGYVMQDDIMHTFMTANEIFHFTAWLRIRSALWNPSFTNAHVAAVVRELGLSGCAKTKVGSPDARGISGGQRKRVSIGMELITEPSVLFLDEPTSGLDSSTAYHLVQTLKKLASVGRTIVTTIHQPSTDMFNMFDRVLVLSNGHIVYNGRPSEVISYFSKLNFKCPKYSNPAEFIMNLAKSDSHLSTKDEGKLRVQELACAYRTHSDLRQWDFADTDAVNIRQLVPEGRARFMTIEGSVGTMGNQLRRRRRATTLGEGDDEERARKKELERDFHEKVKPQHRSNFFVQLIILTLRESLVAIRDPMTTWARMMQTIVLSLMVGLVFLGVGDDQASIQDRLGALFFIVVNQSFSAIMSTVVVFPVSRTVYIREHGSGAFGTLAYYLAKSVADLPYGIVFPIISSLIMYWMVGLDSEAKKFFIFMAVLIVMSNVAQSFGLAVSGGVPTIEIALALVPIVFVPLMLFGGFFLNSGNIPEWLVWLKYLSLFKYGFEILVLNEFEGLTFTCSSSERKNGKCPVSTGAEEISNLGMDNSYTKIYIDFLLLLGLYLMFKVLGYFLLRFTAGRKKA